MWSEKQETTGEGGNPIDMKIKPNETKEIERK